MRHLDAHRARGTNVHADYSFHDATTYRDGKMTDKRVLAENSHVAAISQDLGGDTLFITFNNFGFYRNGSRFWGDKFFLKEGLSAIGIISTQPNWYPRAAMVEIIEAVKQQIKGRKVVTYGHSLGGYGALKYASALNVSISLAFCPQWSIDPADVSSFDHRFMNYFDENLDNGRRVTEQDLGERAFIFFDKMERLDALNAEKLLTFRGTESVIAPFSMHDTVRLVSEGGGAAKIMKLCSQPTTPTVNDFRRLIRSSRNESTTYHNHMLRHLLSRTHNSHIHPSKFSLQSLARTQRDDPFHMALVAHARGDVTLAETELSKCTHEHLHGLNLVPLWQMSNMIRFVSAELLVAQELCNHHPNKTWDCLYVINTFIRNGQSERAHSELARLAKNPDAMQHLGTFAQCSIKLGKVDILELFLSSTLNNATKIALLFHLVNLYSRLSNRTMAFRTLMSLSEICATEPRYLRVVADSMIRIGEYGFALEIRQKLHRASPSDNLLALDVIEAKIPAEKQHAKAQLEALMQTPGLDSACWERASSLYDKMQAFDAALKAIQTAVSIPGSVYSARIRMVALLLRSKKKTRVRKELTVLLHESISDPDRLRSLGDLAYKLGDRDLTLGFAKQQYRCGPANPDAILYSARYFRLFGDVSRATELLTTLYRIERRTPTISDSQWAGLAQGLYDVGQMEFAKNAAFEAIAREPSNVALRNLIAIVELLQKHGEGIQPRTVAPPTRAQSRIARLASMMFRRAP